MTFRADEEKQKGYDRLISRLVGPSIDQGKRRASRDILDTIVERYGPVIDGYPIWHPLVAAQASDATVIFPSERCGYEGLDHTVLLRNAFITCPYAGIDRVLSSVARVAQHSFISGIAEISAEKIDAQLYNPNAHPILVKCEWVKPMDPDGTIPARVAVPLILEHEVPNWRTAQVGETWKTMCPLLLGEPYGSRSSLFVNQDTGQKIKDIWNAIINTGMFGNIRVSF